MDIEDVYVSPAVIEEAIGKLKRGKVGGDSLASDHIHHAPVSLHHFLSHLFTALLRYGFIPTALRMQ